ncbi:hypothetical protein CUMW_093640 [Citrus unshiu]|uniref:CDP-diacylglycerol--inositol 3-phosphatidyltransferase n=1 Tax=Citrus unshiu TaxID=55188 RepID=A0A2H5P0W8_CITUN|nr:hypothetical protein CUMW_093640 [Citrus unshiu]
MAKSSKKLTPRLRKLSVYLYIPNIIGYARVLLNCYAFGICFSNKWLFSVLYFISFVCDAIDGWCARKFNQGLAQLLCWLYYPKYIGFFCRPGLVFVSLLALDIGSHWLQMYSTFLTGKTSHKDVKDSTNWLFKAYYGNRIFMGYCCVACEVLYLILFLIVDTQSESLVDVVGSSLQQGSLLSILVALSLFGWAIKQVVNVIQMKTAADVCVHYDIEKKQKP